MERKAKLINEDLVIWHFEIRTCSISIMLSFYDVYGGGGVVIEYSRGSSLELAQNSIEFGV